MCLLVFLRQFFHVFIRIFKFFFFFVDSLNNDLDVCYQDLLNKAWWGFVYWICLHSISFNLFPFISLHICHRSKSNRTLQLTSHPLIIYLWTQTCIWLDMWLWGYVPAEFWPVWFPFSLILIVQAKLVSIITFNQ